MGVLHYGDDGLFYGDDTLLYGPSVVPAPPLPVPNLDTADIPVLHGLIDIYEPDGSASYHFWTGAEPLTITGFNDYRGRPFTATYTGGGDAIGFTNLEQQVGPAQNSLRISLKGITVADARRLLLDAQGNIREHLPVFIARAWMLAASTGANRFGWAKVPGQAVGFLSDIQYIDGVISAEISSPLQDVDRGRDPTWSYEQERRRYPGDKSFRLVRSIAAGFESNFPHLV